MKLCNGNYLIIFLFVVIIIIYIIIVALTLGWLAVWLTVVQFYRNECRKNYVYGGKN